MSGAVKHYSGHFAQIANKFCNMAFHGSDDAPKVGIVMQLGDGLDFALKQRDAAVDALREAQRSLAIVRQDINDEGLKATAQLLTPTLTAIGKVLREQDAASQPQSVTE